MKNFDVLTVGSATLDIYLSSDNFKLVHSGDVEGGVAICEVYGGKMEVEDVVLTSGGGATNTAVSFVKKDLQTAVVAEMGNDPASLIVFKDLADVGVETEYLVQEPNETTAVSVILLSNDGGRSIVTYRGASAMLDQKDFPWEEVRTRWMHISSMGGNVEFLKKILNWAKEQKVRVSFNPGKRELEQKEKWLPLLSQVEVLFLNREEAGALFGLDYGRDEVWKSEHCPVGPWVTVVTDAEREVRLCMEGKCKFFPIVKAKKVVDTTGAGDAFASGFVSAILYGMDYERAIEWGRKNAQGVLAKIGAKDGLLTLAEVK